MTEVLCIKSFHEDGNEYWSEGNYYTLAEETEDGYEIEHNFGGTGFICAEDFDDYFVKSED